MLINASDTWFYVDTKGHLVEGDESPPEGAATLLVAPGGALDDDLAEAHGITDRLSPSSSVTMTHGITGEEMFLRGGRAVAGHLLAQKPGESRHDADGGVIVARKDKKKVVEVESKHQSGPESTKRLETNPTPGNLNVPPRAFDKK